MSIQIDPSHSPSPSAPLRPQGDGAVQRQPLAAQPTQPAQAAAPASALAFQPESAGSPGAGAAPPAPVAAQPPQTTQVRISEQGRQSLGEAAAALQRQDVLLNALDTGRGASAPRLPQAPGTPEAAAGPALPAQANAASAANTANAAHLSTGTSATATGTGARPAGQGLGPGQALASATTGPPTTAAAAPTTAAVGTTAPAWPSRGVSAPMQSLLSALVQQTTAPVQAQRVLAAQAWPTALLAQVDGNASSGAPGSARANAPAPLQTWLVRQGTVQTPQGPRGVMVTLRVPAPWLQALEQMQAAAMPKPKFAGAWEVWLQPPVQTPPAQAAAPLQAAFTGPQQTLQSGTFALALQAPGASGTRTSALLTLDLQPLVQAPTVAQTGVYGRDLGHLRQDPWLQMAALQASGQVERDEERARHGSAALCDTPDCPYLARAACVQPFCAVLRVVPQVAGVQASVPLVPGSSGG